MENRYGSGLWWGSVCGGLFEGGKKERLIFVEKLDMVLEPPCKCGENLLLYGI
jgi:hypothetical protein